MKTREVNKVSVDVVIRSTCKLYDVCKDTLIGPNKRSDIAEPRRLAMYLIRKLNGESFVEIGKMFNRDHATVYYSVKMVEDALKQRDRPLAHRVQEIINCIESKDGIRSEISEEGVND